MSAEDRIEARIESAFKNKHYTPSESGDHTEEVDIRSSGLTIDEVLDHKWVRDAIINEDENTFHVYVFAESDHFFVTTD